MEWIAADHKSDFACDGSSLRPSRQQGWIRMNLVEIFDNG